MATYFVASGGSNTAPYDTWAKAATSLQTALTAASTAGDIVVIQYNGVPSGDAELAADTSYTVAADVFVISASADDASTAYTPTVMDTDNWIGNSTANRAITLQGADFTSHWYGCTFRVSGSTSDIINASNTNHSAHHDSCYFLISNTGSGERIRLSGGAAAWATFSNCTFQFGATGQYISSLGTSRLINCTVASAGSAPTNLVNQTTGGGTLEFIGCDLSHCTGNLVADVAGPFRISFDRCKLGAGVVPLASQTSNPTLASPEVFISDCHSGDTHMFMGYYNAAGQVTLDTGIYVTAGAAAASWKIVTTSLANRQQPFRTPYIDLYNTGTSAITPYLEIARDGSTTAYKDHQVWAEFSVKTTTGSTVSTTSSDRAALTSYLGSSGSDQAAGSGTGSWTGLSGTAWSGKCGLGSSVTPAEIGYMRARVLVSAASTTIYVDPQIRT